MGSNFDSSHEYEIFYLSTHSQQIPVHVHIASAKWARTESCWPPIDILSSFANIFLFFLVSTYLRDSMRRAVMVLATFAAAADPPRKSDAMVRRVDRFKEVS